MDKERRYSGIGVSPGVAVARAFVHRQSVIEPPRRLVEVNEAPAEWERLARARDIARHQLQGMLESLGVEASGGEAGIIEAHMMTLDDEMLIAALRREIFEKRHNAEWAVNDVAESFAGKLAASQSAMLAERAVDIRDVSRRILHALLGHRGESTFAFKDRCIVVAENLSPSEALALPRERVLGVALDRGGMTSHAALLVRALGIPAVFGLGDFSKSVTQDSIVAIDGNSGVVVLSPCGDEEAHLLNLATSRESLLAEARSRANEPAVSPDGIEIKCLANIESEIGIDGILSEGADGVGLFRTEYLWLAEGSPVDEARQTTAYTCVAKAVGSRPLAIRAFDIGGDKLRGSLFGKCEDNPFLGVRSIRLLLRNQDFFKTQIRAVLCASAASGRRIDFTLPLIADIQELIEAKAIIGDCADELENTGVKFVAPRIGIMVEVPSAALTAHVLARHCDYISLGTNDLTQYTLAVDRCNEAVAQLYRPLHPSVLRLVAMTVKAAHAASIDISACGEMAGDALSAIALVGLGVTSLSMSAAAIPLVKETIRHVPVAEAGKISALVEEAATASQILHFVRQLLAHYSPEILKQC